MSFFGFLRPRRGGSTTTERVAEFRAALDRERSRADRTGRAFSLVKLRPRSGKSSDGKVLPEDPRAWQELSKILQVRIRAYDLFGTNEDGDLCVLLPETTGTEAWRFVDAIRRSAAESGLLFTCSVLEYPHWSWNRPKPRNSDSDDDPKAGEPAGESDDHEVEPLELPRETQKQPTFGPKAQPKAPAEPREADDLEPREVGDLSDSFYVELPWWKRTMDVIVSGLTLLLLSPLLVLIVAAIKATSRGPVIFRQQRAGVGGQPFWFYKFRTMSIDAEDHKAALRAKNEVDGPIFKIKRDPRITKVGRWLRKSSMDELPQLWNVFIGDMSLVGPRPPTLDEIAHYHPWQRRRLHLIGGLTCFWQVSGRSDLSFEQWMRLDARYAKRPSLWRDLGLLVRTPWAILTGRGAY